LARTRVPQQLNYFEPGSGVASVAKGYSFSHSRQPANDGRLGEESEKEFNMLGRVLYAWREKEGLTIREAAKLFGFSYSTLSRIENGMSVDGKTDIGAA
jgi:hypothetical protein